MSGPSLDEFYEFDHVEEEFLQVLDESLNPRGPDMMYDVVAGFGLPPGVRVLDVGCGRGEPAIELAKRFGFEVVGIDPIVRAEAVPLAIAIAERLPVRAATIDLVWCKDSLVHVADLESAYGEIRRVLRPGGKVIVSQMFHADRMESKEAERILGPASGWPTGAADPVRLERAVATAGLTVDECIDFGGEWGEYRQETSGDGARRSFHASRMLREPDRYIERFGQTNYEIMLDDAFWHIYRMIGKLTGRIYVLTA